MKKYLLLFLLLFTKAEIKSQSLMTVGQIYNYDIGDIFIRTVGGYYAPPTITTVTITNKYFSLLFDSVFYISNSTSYTSPACSLCVAIYDTTYNDTSYYTNLNDTVGAGLGAKLHEWYPGCIDTAGYTGMWVDSVFYDTSFCSKLTTRIYRMDNGPQLNDSCYSYFEAFLGYDEYGEGVGQRRHYYNTCSQGFPYCEEGGHLMFYKKGNDSCGFRPMIPIPSSIAEYDAAKAFKIFPNPFAFQTKLTFDKEQKNSYITITTILGEKMQTFNFNGKELTIGSEQLRNGIYFVKVFDGEKSYCKKLIVEHD